MSIRIYFDTEVLIAEGWPRPSEVFRNFVLLATTLDDSPVIVEPVEREFCEHWLRDRVRESGDAANTLAKLNRKLDAASEPPVEFKGINKHELRASITRTAAARREELGIGSAPISTISLEDLFAAATRHESPFNEKGSGFQDAVIARSIIEDFRASAASEAWIITANTKDFDSKQLGAVASEESLVRVVPSIVSAHEMLMNKISGQIAENAKRDAAQLRDAVEQLLPRIETFIRGNLVIPAYALGPGLIEVTDVAVNRVGGIAAEPYSERSTGQRFAIDFDADVEVRSTHKVYPSSVSARSARVGERLPETPSDFYSTILRGPQIETRQTSAKVRVSASAVNGADPKETITFLGVRFEIDPYTAWVTP